MAEELDLPQHVLRFWETRFTQIKPMKRGGGRRYYRPDDVELLRGIRRLLYGEGYTIKGVQRILKEQGLRHVAAFGQNGVLDPVPRDVVAGLEPEDDEIDVDAVSEDHDIADRGRAPNLGGVRREPVFEPRHSAPSIRSAEPVLRRGASEPVPSVSNFPAAPPDEPDQLETYLPPLVSAGPAVPERRRAPGPADDPFRPPRAEERRDPHLRPEDPEAQRSAPARASLSGDDLRILQTALAELLECKRLLDQSR